MRKAIVLALTLASVGCGARDSNPRVQTFYLPMRDGVRIAIDLWLPENLEPGQKIPALMQATRYWRALDVVEDGVAADSNFETASRLNEAGYAYAIVDARGTGASFGSRAYEYNVKEVRDYGEMCCRKIFLPG